MMIFRCAMYYEYAGEEPVLCTGPESSLLDEEELKVLGAKALIDSGSAPMGSTVEDLLPQIEIGHWDTRA